MDKFDRMVGGFLIRYGANTAKAYGGDLDIYRTYCEGSGVDPVTADHAHVDGFARWLESRGNRTSTVARRMSTVRQFYKVMHLVGAVESDPAQHARVPRVHRDVSGGKYLPIDEMRALVKESRSGRPDEHVLVVLMIALGLRVSEACAVNIEDLNSGMLPIKGKGGRDESIPVPVEVVEIIKSTGRVSGPAVTGKHGSRLDRGTAYRIVKRVSDRAGVGSVTPHDLRAAYITAALDDGMSIYQVQDMARHAKTSTTELYDRARRRRSNDGNERVTGLLSL